MSTRVIQAISVKPVDSYVSDLASAASRRGFFIHNESKMDMAHTFGRHGVEVAEGFDLHMIQVCKPPKAAKSLSRNPERAVLMPKFIVVFGRDGQTHIRFLRFAAELIADVIDDDEFPGSLQESYDEIEAMIHEAC